MTRLTGMLRIGGYLLAVAAVTLLSCDRSTPTQPETERSATASVVFVDAESLAEHQDTIRSIIQSTVESADGRLDVGNLQFTVSMGASRAIPGWGLGGYTLGPAEVEIVVDPNVGNLSSVLQARLSPIVAHEVHHCVRWRGPGPYGTLLDALVFEGLADHFALELVGGGLPPWSMALTPAEIQQYLARAEPEFDSLGFDFDQWFFGTRDLPRWTGYSLGYHLVGEYLARHPGHSAADLVFEPSESFRPD